LEPIAMGMGGGIEDWDAGLGIGKLRLMLGPRKPFFRITVVLLNLMLRL